MSRGDAWFARGDPVGRVFDEGVELDSAARVLDGQVPYRDFALIYAPGQAYALAAVFRLFGESMAVARGYDWVIRLLLCISVWALAREVTSPRVALVPFALATVQLAAAYFYAYAMFPALLFALLSATVCLGFLRVRTRRRVFAAGVLAGIATCFRHDIGLYVVVSEAAVLLLWALAHRLSLTEVRSNRAVVQVVRMSWLFVVGLATPLAPVVLYLVALVPPADLWYAFVAFPLAGFRSAFGLPYPELSAPITLLTSAGSLGDAVRAFALEDSYLTWGLFWTEPLIAAAGLLYVAFALRGLRRAGADERPLWGMALVTMLAITFFNQALNRADGLHLLPSGILAFVVLCGLAWRAFAVPRLWAPTVIALLLTGAVMAPSYLLSSLVTVRDTLQSNEHGPCQAPADLARAACVFIFPGQAQAIQFIATQTSPNEAIFVGDSRHDRALPNDALFYFVASRRNATRFDDFVSGFASTAPTQESIIADLARNQVNWIVLSSMFEDYVEPSTLGRPTGVTVLDRFIRSNYVQVKEFDRYTAWQRR